MSKAINIILTIIMFALLAVLSAQIKSCEAQNENLPF